MIVTAAGWSSTGTSCSHARSGASLLTNKTQASISSRRALTPILRVLIDGWDPFRLTADQPEDWQNHLTSAHPVEALMLLMPDMSLSHREYFPSTDLDFVWSSIHSLQRFCRVSWRILWVGVCWHMFAENSHANSLSYFGFMGDMIADKFKGGITPSVFRWSCFLANRDVNSKLPPDRRIVVVGCYPAQQHDQC